MHVFELICPECGHEFVVPIDKVGLEGFSVECPMCDEEVRDSCIMGESGGPKPLYKNK